jgi:DNA invertase Pin-like site-specific DNA recombinase
MCVAKYLRISAEDIDLDGFDKYESNSIANQRDYLDEFIRKTPDLSDCEVIEIIDDGWSGTNFSRPGVRRLVKMAQAGQIKCIVVKDLSRWGRNYIEVGDFLEQKFPEWGVRFISLNDYCDTANIANGNDGINIAFRNLIHELYSRDLSEKVRSAKTTLARNGKSPGGAAFYGYIRDPSDKHKFILDEHAASVVKRVFDFAINGLKFAEISKMLNDEKIPTPMERKRQLGYHRHRWSERELIWRDCMISKIIRDERYTGKLICGKRKVTDVGSKQQRNAPQEDWIIVPDALPKIISEEKFKIANLQKRVSLTKKKSESKLVLSRKLKCAHCDTAMKAMHRKHEIIYNCNSSKFKNGFACAPSERLPEKDVIAAVFDALKQQISFFDFVSQKKIARNEIDIRERLIEKSKIAKMHLWEKFHLGEITREVFHRENEKLDAQTNIKKVSRKKLQTDIKKLTRTIAEEFIREVNVYSSTHIEVIFSFADEWSLFDTGIHRLR